jgi:hypothetical protein
MLFSIDDLRPLPKAKIKLGKPLEFSVYDRRGKLLLAQGQLISSLQQVSDLMAKGYYNGPKWIGVDDVIDNSQIASVSRPSAISVQSPSGSLAKRGKYIEDPSETGRRLAMNLPGDAETFDVRLLGVLEASSLIISAPKKDDAFIYVKEGQLWEFSSFYSRSMYQFCTSVDKVLFSPFPYLHLCWPQPLQITHQKIRDTRRANTALPAAIYSSGDTGQRAITALLQNLSTGGAELRLNKPLPTATTSPVLAFQVHVQSERVLVESPVRVIEQYMDNQGELRVRIAFEGLSQLSMIAIHAYVHEQLLMRVENPLYSLHAD